MPGEKDGVVSVFVGQFADFDELAQYVEFDYGDWDDDAAGSPFTEETGIGFYDEDFAEGSVDTGRPAAHLLEHSYGPSIDPQAGRDLGDLPDGTALYLVYDFDATGAAPGRLALVGVYSYTKG